MTTADLTERATAGDEKAFAELVGRHRHELQVYCYRMLGSAQDAEDALQEILLAAWRALPGFEGRSSIRTWLYRIAATRCLNALRSASRRTSMDTPQTWDDPPEPAGLSEVPWLEPFPDLLFEQVADPTPGPESRYEGSESISLAFVTALQLLGPRQRAALVLRDVLGFRAQEAADILDTTVESVTSALKRARATLRRNAAEAADREPPPLPGSPAERELVHRFTQAYTAGDVDGVVALLTEDAWLTMPPAPFDYRGRETARRALTILLGAGRTYRLVPTRANRQPAFGLYVADPHGDVMHANGLVVMTLSGSQISALTRFDNSNLARFGLPRTLDA
jgi:RNA polymerase sigma-70 factor (TIGR02960 family)